MLSRFFTCPERLQQLRNSSAHALLEGFADQLWQAGYARTIAQKHIGIVEHFTYWACQQGIAFADLSEASIKDFDRHLSRCRCQCPCHGRTYPLKRQDSSTRLFLGYLCGAGIAPRAARHATDSEPVLLSAFHDWMRQQRGTCNASLCNYSYSIRDLLRTVGDDARKFDAATFFGLLACTGLRVSEALHLRFDDITSDGLLIQRSKFQKSRLIPLHETTQKALEDYLQIRRPYAPFDDHVFVSTARRPLLILSPEIVFRTLIKKIGLPRGPGLPRPTPHSLRHTFAVRALENCPDGRDRITKHMLALSTYLGHSEVAHTYWYLEATPDLMKNIAIACENYVSGGGRP